LLGLPGVLLAFCILTAAGGVLLPVADHLSGHLAPLVSRFAAHARGTLASNLLLGARVVMIVGVTSFFHKAPEFVYRTF
jgi:hypothetical protein